MKRLVKSKNKMVGGVIAGVAEYYNWDIDVTILRLVFAVLSVFFFPAVVAYIVALFIVPNAEHIDDITDRVTEKED